MSEAAYALLSDDRQCQKSSVFPVSDPLQAEAPLPFETIVFPYGFALRVRSNDERVLRSADDIWAAIPQQHCERPLELRVIVTAAKARFKKPQPAIFRAQANMMSVVADARNFGCCDLNQGLGFAFINTAVAADREYLRYNFLESMACSLLDAKHLVMLHAACVARQGRGILLAGESGAGKSTFAYACARSGWTYISDDTTALIRRNGNRTVAGNSLRFRFRPDASKLFPDLEGRLKNRSGKPTLEVDTGSISRIAVGHHCAVDHIIYLNRDHSASSSHLETVPGRRYLPKLFDNPWPLELPVHDERRAAIERLLVVPSHELTYSNFSTAIRLLDQLI